MATLNLPFQLGMDVDSLAQFPATRTVVRRLSDMPGMFQDKAAAEQLSADDPVIYRFWEIENHDAPRGLSLGVTAIYPGTVGREFHMTKGHFHRSPGDEIYITLSGQGKLMLFTRDGDHKELDMLPGSICYIHTSYAHRTVNTGTDEFRFLAVWPPAIAHDYESIVRTGFPVLALSGDHGAELQPNPHFIREAAH